MTNEERDLITRFIERVGGPPAAGGFGSLPGVGSSPTLPPIDRDADALLAELFQKYPEARYRITQVAVVQEQALAQASQRLAAMQQEIQRLQTAAASSSSASPWGQQQQAAPASRGLFGGLFGGSQPRPAAPPPPPAYAPPPPSQYAPQPQYAPQQGAFQPRGTGFLGGALQTAAGVAGGVLAANALTSLFSGGHGGGGEGGGLFGGGASAPGEVGYLPDTQAASPWAAPADPASFTPDPYDQGGAAKDAPTADPYADNSSWSPAPDAAQDTGWTDASSSDGGGWTDSSSDDGWTDSSD
jgi:hypothetical protein